MRFEDLFRPSGKSADTADRWNPRFSPLPPKATAAAVPPSGNKPQSDVSAPSALPLVPLQKPFIEGLRYRWACATEARTRLELYFEDADGPWLRSNGVLIAVDPDIAGRDAPEGFE